MAKLILRTRIEAGFIPPEELLVATKNVQKQWDLGGVIHIPTFFDYEIVEDERDNSKICEYDNKAYNLLSFVYGTVDGYGRTYAIISDINTGSVKRVDFNSITIIDKSDWAYKRTKMSKYLPMRETNILLQNGIESMEELDARWEKDPEVIEKLPQIGKKAIKAIQKAILEWEEEAILEWEEERC